MRIISGTARGTKLNTLEGKNTRPTLDRVRESLFNIIQNEIIGCCFLDVFSGSGAVGLEAASRGASKVILCDKSKDAIQIIKQNIEKTHLQKKVEIHFSDFKSMIQKLQENPDIVYIDPPYETDYAIEVIELLIEKNKLKSNSIFIIETDREQEILEKINKLPVNLFDKRKYGRAYLLFLNKIEEQYRKGQNHGNI